MSSRSSPDRFLAQVAVMAVVTYLVRVIPLALCRGQLKSRWVRDFLFYVPNDQASSPTSSLGKSQAPAPAASRVQRMMENTFPGALRACFPSQ